MDTNSIGYRAHTNIALIKYWGKRNKQLFLPVTSSLSLTLNEFYTETFLSWQEEGKADSFTLNGIDQEIREGAPISRFLDLFRDLSGIYRPVQVVSDNFVPTAAGLASSASAYAALASASNILFDTRMNHQELSTYARQGSGSATRSLFAGFALWHKGQGDDSASSYAEQIDEAKWDIGMITVVVNKQEKAYSSREGMEHTRLTSPFYQMWPQTVAEDLDKMIHAIQLQDFTQVGEIAEHNAMKMHATMIASNPSFTYWEPDSIIAMNMVRNLRAANIECYFTMDAGPNIKVLCRLSQAQDIVQAFQAHFAESQLIVSGPGPAPVRLN